MGAIKGLRLTEARASRQRSWPPSTVDFLFEPERGRRCWASCCRITSTFPCCQMLLEAKASEHSARMVAMKNATDNANATDQGPHARIQQDAPGQHHEGTAGNLQRARWRSAERALSFYEPNLKPA